jgi:hypothetical protein
MKSSQFIAGILLLVSVQAHADWTDPGAAYRCDNRAQLFSIVSVMETSSPEDAGTVSAPEGFSMVSGGSSVKCSLRHAKVVAGFSVRPPQPTGMCGGITLVSLQTLSVNGREIFEAPTLLNHYCLEDEALNSIRITESNGVVRINICYAKWDWGVGYHDARCVDRAP